MTGTLRWLNTDSEHLCNIAILGQNDRLPWQSARICFENQIDFNYLEECFLLHDSDITDAGIGICSMHYSLLIVEAGYGLTLGDEAEAVMERLARAGRVIFWDPSAGADVLLNKIASKVPPSITLTPAHPELRIRRVRKEGDEYLILFNEGQSPFQGAIQLDAAAGVLVDMDSRRDLPWTPEQEIHLPPHACVVIKRA